ncbi:hypothetical protein [Streptomyces sp. CBMA29]|uniref:hypothetical protein n=1 Tax=Streptomyces sp. CBMA29 TaxID=1896314 RepID=UPI001CB746DD|nr:hypothetical protein [Streptomyces sp. CBMA29]MBD0735673.1 hypothetical protein [Streptomyces sp. CBMA29]
MTLPGARGAALVEWISGLSLGQVGDAPGGDPETAAAETAEFARMAVEHSAFEPAESLGLPQGATTGPAAPAARSGPAAPSGPAGTAKGLPVEDVIVVTRTGYHLLRFVEAPFDGGVFLHLWLDREHANLALAMMRVRDLAERLVLA